jgi:hypothetical protein
MPQQADQPKYAEPADYRGQPLAVGDRVTFISDVDGTLVGGTIAYLSDDHVCIDSGGALVVRKAWLHRTVGKPTVVRYRTIAALGAVPDGRE